MSVRKKNVFTDLLLIIVLNVLFAFLSIKLNIFEHLFQSLKDYQHEMVGLEQLMLILFLLLVSVVYFLFRRWWESSQYALYIEHNALKDPLTKLLNRRAIERSLTSERDRYLRYHQEFSIVLFDIDGFNEINKNLGTLEGDRILIDVAKMLKKNTRKTDFIGRWGEEEFLILCPVCKSEQAVVLAEKLRAKIYRTLQDGIELSASFAVAQSDESESLDDLIKRVDLALYHAKRAW
ncbi:GGDEF domain-containing protein [Psychromonas sp. KJ10-10]|uniref:GGDEF domain-containing protein n=1 Tax=Psychromonas sp. KJ10-10 TaxID=3391823 RepID=UPI0039B5683E